MSENYKIVEISEKGRGIVAEKSFDEGEILFDEVPLCSAQFSWGRHLGYKSCFHCFRPLEAPNEAIRRLTKNEIETLPDEFGEMAKNKIEICRKTEMEFCSEECAKDADYLYMKLLNENWKRKTAFYAFLLKLFLGGVTLTNPGFKKSAGFKKRSK